MDLKIIPSEITKARLVSMYRDQFPENFILNEINVIISDNRKNEKAFKLSIGGTPCVKKLRWREVVEFANVHGWPRGYAKPEKVTH